MSKSQRSPFAAALGRLLEHPKGYTKAEWARVLHVTPSAISQWLSDRTVPRPAALHSLVELAALHFGPETMLELDGLAVQPAETVSPLGHRMSPTIGDYMLGPVREGFLRLLRALPLKAQEDVLIQAGELCDAYLSGDWGGDAVPVALVASDAAETAAQGSATGVKRWNPDVATSPLSALYDAGEKAA